MNGAIAIFAKTLGLTPVKTRLAEGIGRDRADEFYRFSVAATAETLKQVQDGSSGKIQPYWALAEAEAVGLPQWNTFPSIWTGEGDLGARLNCVSEQLFVDHDFVMMIGTDSPQLSPDIFIRAVTALESGRHDCVIGPSVDGGFYLLVSKRPVPSEIWKGIAYSKDTTLDELSTLLKKDGWRIHYLSTELDVDTKEDLVNLKLSFTGTDDVELPARQSLFEWLDALN